MKIREYFGEVKLNQKEKGYLLDKIKKIKSGILTNFKDNETLAELRVSQDKKKEWSIELSFDVPKSKFEASKKGFGLTEVMDEIEEVITRQILRKKEKLQSLRKRGSRSLRKMRTIDGAARF